MPISPPFSSVPSGTTFPTYYNSPLRYLSPDSHSILIPLHHKSASSTPNSFPSSVSHYDTHLPNIWILLDAIVSRIRYIVSTWSGNTLDNHIFEGNVFVKCLQRCYTLLLLCLYVVLHSFYLICSVLL